MCLKCAHRYQHIEPMRILRTQEHVASRLSCGLFRRPPRIHIFGFCLFLVGSGISRVRRLQGIATPGRPRPTLPQGNQDVIQVVRMVESSEKDRAMMALLAEAGLNMPHSCGKALVFANTKRMCEQLSNTMHRAGISCTSIHGDKDSAPPFGWLEIPSLVLDLVL